jgi:hypothetical protein
MVRFRFVGAGGATGAMVAFAAGTGPAATGAALAGCAFLDRAIGASMQSRKGTSAAYPMRGACALILNTPKSNQNTKRKIRSYTITDLKSEYETRKQPCFASRISKELQYYRLFLLKF